MTLATVLLTSSISANELAIQGFSGSTQKVESIGAFDGIPTNSLNSKELKEQGKFLPTVAGIGIGFGLGFLYTLSICQSYGL